jgi:hypothetical protein
MRLSGNSKVWTCRTTGEHYAGCSKRLSSSHAVCLVHLVYLVSLVQPNKRDRPNKPNNGLHTLADFFSILLKGTT